MGRPGESTAHQAPDLSGPLSIASGFRLTGRIRMEDNPSIIAFIGFAALPL
jgi:hypothetical protein